MFVVELTQDGDAAVTFSDGFVRTITVLTGRTFRSLLEGERWDADQ